MNNNQSEALRLANILTLNVGSQLINRKQAAAELRRLHEVNAELVEALEKALYGLKYHTSQTGSLRLTNGVMQVINDALAKAEGKE